MDSASQHKVIPVFCSHRGVDKPAVREFATRLRQAGIDAWFDQWEIQPSDDIVAKMNEGLDTCEVGLVFFSSEEHDGPWFRAEVATLTFEMIENGKRLIPVMIDAKAPIPPFLRPRARRGIDEFDAIVDAIRGTTSRPPLAPPPATAICHRIEIELRPATPAGTLDLIAHENGAPIAQLGGLTLPPEALQNFAQFLHGGFSTAFRGPHEAAALSLGEALARLGQLLGAVLFTGPLGAHIARRLDTLAIGDELQLVFASADATLLGLPFEAARLPDGRVPALLPAVSMLRRVIDAPEPAHAPQAGPLKILVAVGAPDEGQTRSAVLDLEAELQRILDAVDVASRHGNAQVKILEVGHPDEIRKALAADAFHVLHLSCHGSPGSVELEDEDGKAISVSAEQLAAALLDAHQPLPLVFLATCDGGSPAGETASFAQALVQKGIPQVLAMQTRVSDDYATQLAAAFYRALGTPERPTASRALAHARRELETQRAQSQRPTPPEYATPSLFCAGLEQPLLDRRLAQQDLRLPPVHQAGSLAVPQLKLGDLIGRRAELRRSLRILRSHPATVAELGERAGVVLQGMGGVGKSSLAGRVMARLTEDGWLCAALSGPFDAGKLINAIAGAGRKSKHKQWKTLAASLAASLGTNDDLQRIELICDALTEQRLLIVLDNFEDNLDPAPAGARFKQAFHAELLTQLCEAAHCGRLLLTSRYAPADLSPWLETLPLGPLSAAQTRKLILRLPSLLVQLEADDANTPLTGALQTLLLRVGGHPRMLEYLDAVLHNGRARLPDVTARLKRQAQALGVDVNTPPADLDEALALTLQLGTRDVLLDTLLTLADDDGDRPTLLQAAASNLPISVAGVAHALHGAVPDKALVATTRKALTRLSVLSLLSFVSEQEVFVHRWTAEVLLTSGATLSADTRNAILTRAGHYRWWRVEHETRDLDDAIEATRNLLAGEAFDAVSGIAGGICDFLTQANQLASAGSFAGEVCTTLPPTHPGFAALADTEASALLALGYTDAALARYRQLLAHHQRLAQAEPQRADYQRDLSVSYNKLGDLMTALGQGDEARDYFLKDLDIAQRLAQAEPQRADYQRDLSISYNKLGDLMTALGKGDEARDYFLKDLAIAQRLAQAEPQRADYQRDLIVSLVRIAQTDPAHAVEQLRRALDIARALKARGLLVKGLDKMIAALQAMLAEAGLA
ncbi:CHAT domain-containing protein [Zoogloea sp. 1C4]|uniref:CHAT domain-containing protein n=1 Tax=Zoogloea sp. 1C4 TaxID=2570190 RepID=UPI0012921403|nr:CHAT domain-containing protein [Zoogloea sp. 1C4]